MRLSNFAVLKIRSTKLGQVALNDFSGSGSDWLDSYLGRLDVKVEIIAPVVQQCWRNMRK